MRKSGYQSTSQDTVGGPSTEECAESYQCWQEESRGHQWSQETHEIQTRNSGFKENPALPENNRVTDQEATFQLSGTRNSTGFQN